ncbi:calcium-binding protein [Tropicimonas sediminicola]|uniref:Ca2+-binding protein, RTX toxin-related n=1 Tax=Tropicimonas sediminicola TaxID=1031541 RepID=A0A239EHD6_9RHOB|nr:calcium-binding protein [Tropicimonas sediminicola]SNS43979.1 Ca2+-binding protein, RTX toxin-related [Tropicimonas sediminicola]
MTTRIEFQSDAPLGHVDDDMFGGNFLIDRDRMDAGTYDEAIRDLGLTNIRYPGGSITEWYFDINDPDRTSIWDPMRGEMRELLPLSTFLAQAGAAGVGVNLVIPTGTLLEEGKLGSRHPSDAAFADVKAYVADVLAGKYGDAEIVGIEIGNEYWLSGEMTDAEYARIASVIAEAAQEAIDDFAASGDAPRGWQEPEIAVQIGQYGRYSTDPGHLQNDVIMEELSDEAVAAIDAVVAHYYTWGSYEELANFGYYFGRQQSWLEDARFAGIEYHITEWNTANGRTEETGLKQASALLWMFSEMVEQGVDAAYVWPVQQYNSTNMAGNEGDLGLSLAGEAFRLLSDSVKGMDLVAREGGTAGDVHVYSKGAETVVFIASRAEAAERFVLDLESLGLDGQFYWMTELGADGPADEVGATPVLTISAGEENAAAQQGFTVGSYGVLRVTFLDGTRTGTDADRPDAYSGSERADILKGSGSADRLLGLGGADRIDGGAGADWIEGGAGDDTIDGGNQNDRIDAGTGDDLVLGGNGRDLVFLGAGNDVFRDNFQNGTFGADTVMGGAGNDLLVGRAGDDTLIGGADADTVFGGNGADKLQGNRGNDVLYGGGGADSLDGGAGSDLLQGEAGNDVLSGGQGNDQIFGGRGDDQIDAGDGHDVVEGGNGADTVRLGDGDDLFRDTGETGAAGSDRVWGEAGNDTLTGQGGDDWLSGGSGDDRLSGGVGNDTLDGGTGDDLAWGGAGEDVLLGGGGADRLRGGDGADRLDGGAGGDDLKGDRGNDTLLGRAGDDYLDGWAGNDDLSGGAGNDRLIGARGRDILNGGRGDDRLTGGAGADTFVFAADDGADIIVGFEEMDVIRITADGIGYKDLEIGYLGDDRATIGFAGTEITITGLGADLDASDFVFG